MDNKIKKENKEQKEKSKSIIVIVIMLAIIGVIFIFKDGIMYQVARNEFDNKNYYKAIEIYEMIEDYQDSESMITESYYRIALDTIKSNRMDAIKAFENLGGYKDSKEKITEIKKSILADAKKEIKDKNFDQAQKYLDCIKKFSGVKKTQKELYYQKAIYLNDNRKYTEAKELFEKTKGYKKTDDYLRKTIYELVGNSYEFNQVSAYYGVMWILSFSDKFYVKTLEVPSNNIIENTYDYYMKGDTIYYAEENSDYYKEYLTLHSVKKKGNKIESFSNGQNIVWKKFGQ